MGPKTYDPTNLSKAVDQVWNQTTRSRSKSNGGWSKEMARVVNTVASKKGLDTQTLKRHFVKRLEVEQSTKGAKEGKQADTKRRADAVGLLNGIEKKALYDWSEYMRQYYSPPTSTELRGQVGVAESHSLHHFITLFLM